jgi:transcriptional regulator GlxA family with amidase domain
MKKLVAFTLYPGVTPLDLVGPLTVLRKLGPTWPFRSVVVSQRLEPLETDTPIKMIAAATFEAVPNPFAVIVPGGGDATLAAMHDDGLLRFVRSAAQTAQLVGSTGNGALILAAAGLLQGKLAAIHWAYAEHLQRFGVTYAHERWLDDGKFLTAAGGTAGIDAMLHLVARFHSESAARLAQLGTEYDPHPPFGGIDWTSVQRSDFHAIAQPA